MDKFLPVNEDFKQQNLQERLEQTECPFNWMKDFELVPSTKTDKKLKKTRKVFKTEACNQNFETYVKYMRTTYDLGIKNDDNVILFIGEWNEFLINVKNKDQFFITFDFVLNHIFISSVAHVLFKKKYYEEVEESIEVLEALKQNDLFIAGVSGVKAKFFATFGKSGYEEVFVHVMFAVYFDPEETEWLRLATSTLRNIHLQDIEYPESQKAEFRLFQELIYYHKNPYCLIHFGNYRLDIVNELISEHRDEYDDFIGFAYHNCGYDCFKCKEIHEYIRQGLAYFKKALTVEELQLVTRLKVIKGVTNIPSFYRKSFLDFTSIWIGEVEKNIYNEVNNGKGEAFYVIWKYYQNLGMDNSRYVWYLKRSAMLGFPLAKKELIPITYRENVGCYDPQRDILEVMHLIPGKSNKLECLAQLVYYHIVIKKCFAKGIPFIDQLKEEDPDIYSSSCFQEHSSWFLMKDNKVNLTTELECLCDWFLKKYDNKSM